MKYLVSLDLNQNELQNPRLQNLASAPSNPVAGQIYFNTTTNKAMVYDGTTWIPWESSSGQVTGVKGSSETTYRTGNVNITAANVDAAPTSHASSATTYGIGTSSNYGHVRLSDSISSTSSTSLGIAATPKAVKDAVATATAYSDELEEALGAAAYKNVDSTVTSGSNNLPTSAAVASAIGAVDAMRFKGTIGTGGTVTSLPSSHKQGDTYRVITAGTYAGQTCEIGDLVIALGTSGTTSSDWTVAQTNIDGAIVSISGTSPVSVTGSGSSRTIAHETSGVTAASKGDTSNQTPIFGGTFKVLSGTVNATGHLTAFEEHTVKIPNSLANSSSAGLMSTTDYTKLQNVLSWSNAYIQPGDTSVTVSTVAVNAYFAYMNGDAVVVDLKQNGSGLGSTFSIAEPQASQIVIWLSGYRSG